MMNYRQWKKKYKKDHGYNPLVKDDRRKRAKAERIERAIAIRIYTSQCAQTLLSAKHLLSYSIQTYKSVKG